jgi:glycosyltransferase involved in cell wall biosynthesis
MRIALCADGRSPHTQRWANAVADRGHEVALVWSRREFTSEDLPSFDPSISHYVHDPPARDRRPWMLPVAAVEPRRLARRLQPDLVHGLWLSGHGWTAHRFGIRPLVLTALGSDVLDLTARLAGTPTDRLTSRYVAWRTRAAVAASDVVLADSTSLAAALRELVPGTETRIARFGIDVVDPPRSARSRWRRRLGIGDDDFVLLSSRLVRPNYNIDTIIRALPRIRRELPQAVLILKELPRFSDPEYRRVCLDLAAELGVRNAVRTIGELERSELLELHAAADVYVSVPSADGTAVSVLEAMAAGAAVVASDVPGIDPFILRQNDTALLVSAHDPGSLAAAIVELGLDAERRSSLVERARRATRLYADFDRELDRAVLLYEELVAARKRG